MIQRPVTQPPAPVAAPFAESAPQGGGAMNHEPLMPLEFLPLAEPVAKSPEPPWSQPAEDVPSAQPQAPDLLAPSAAVAAAGSLQDLGKALPLEFNTMDFTSPFAGEQDSAVYAPPPIWVGKEGSVTLAFYNAGSFPNRVHWVTVAGRRTKYVCHGSDCQLCRINDASVEHTFPVYDPTDERMKIYEVPGGRTPKAQLPQLMHILQQTRVFPVLIHIKRKVGQDVFEVKARHWPAGINTGVDAFREFTRRYAELPFSLNPGARKWSWSELMAIPEIRKKALMEEVPTA